MSDDNLPDLYSHFKNEKDSEIYEKERKQFGDSPKQSKRKNLILKSNTPTDCSRSSKLSNAITTEEDLKEVSRNLNIFSNSNKTDQPPSPVQASVVMECGNPQNKAKFRMDKKIWSNLFKCIIGRRIKNPNWVDVIRSAIKKSDPYCSYAFRWHTVNSGDFSERVFACSGHCGFSGCSRKISVISYREDPRMFHVRYTGNRYHVGIKSIQLKGKRREELKEKLVHSLPRNMYLKKIGALSSDVFHSGNRDDAPSQAVLKKARYEARLVNVPDFDNQWNSLDCLRKFQARKFNNKLIRGTLQQISQVPPGIMLWSEQSVRIFIQNAQNDIIYIDATGGVLPSGAQSPYYIYEIVTRHPQKGKSPFAVATFVTNRHNIANISNFLSQFRSDVSKLTKRFPAKVFICDGSMALIKSIIQVNMRESLEAYISRCYSVIQGSANLDMLSRPFLHLCTSHTMKNFKQLACRVPKVKREFMHIFGLLVCCKEIKKLRKIIYHLTILLISLNSNLVDNSWSYLKKRIEKQNIPPPPECVFDHEASGELLPDADWSESNPFTELLYLDIARATKIATDAGFCGSNSFYCPEVMTKFKTFYVPKICLWGALLVGDLGRFGTTIGYEKYKHFYAKSSVSNKQNLAKDNRTQGIMEKSQQELKRTRFNNRRFKRLDEIAVVYDQLHDSLIREYQDNLIVRPKKRKVDNRDQIDQEIEKWGKRCRNMGNDKSKGIYLQPPSRPLKASCPIELLDNDVLETEIICEGSSQSMALRFRSPKIDFRNLVHMSNVDFEILSSNTNFRRDWFTSDIINTASLILSSQYPNADGLQSTTLYTTISGPKVYAPFKKFIQILFVHDNHWVAASNIFSFNQNTIQIYDSSYLKYTENDKYAISLLMRPTLGTNKLQIEFPPVQQQTLGASCGPFAISFCIALCERIRPEDIVFDEINLRKNIYDGISSKRFSPNFNIGRNHNKTNTKFMDIQIFCNCRLPYIQNQTMIECTSCLEWYHPECCNTPVPTEALEDCKIEWHCEKCNRC
ncbi:uncharacterized protein LOC144431350 [Styela clava]